MVDVFISYKREERARCERIAQKLKALDLDVWFDARLTTGHSFDREIEQTIKKAKAVLVLWSPASAESDWVRNEAAVGKERGVLAAAELFPCELPIAFRTTHFERLHEPDFTDDHPGWVKVLERLGALTGRPGLATCSRALGEAQAPLRTWAAAHPRDPMAGKLKALAARLAGDEAPQRVSPALAPPRKGMAPAAMAAALAGAAALGWIGANLMGPEGPSSLETATGPTLPLDTPAWAQLIGTYRLAPDGDCQSDPFTLAADGAVLSFASAAGRQEEAILGENMDGWLETRAGEQTSEWRRDGAQLTYRLAGDASSATLFEVCGEAGR